MHYLILNGPNLNLLGKREPEVYGHQTFGEFLAVLQERFPKATLAYYQSNHEGNLVDKIQEAGFRVQGIILNAGALTHTSIAIRDAIAAIPAPVIEVHISNVFAREAFRHHSVIAAVAKGSIVGLGLEGYALALAYLMGNSSADTV